MPELWCKNGAHFYDRESQRGRKPLNCPDHQPVKPKIKINTQSILGAKSPESSSIPIEKSSIIDKIPGLRDALEETNTIVLWCEHGEGHEWERESKRGRQPRFCGEHTQSAPKPLPGARSARTREKELEEITERISSLSQRVESAEKVDEIAYRELQVVNRDETFNNWMKFNTRLLNEVTALRSNENKKKELERV